jgi:hypothetical protein
MIICKCHVPTVPLNRGSGVACGVENIHAEIVHRISMAAHEASASKTARLRSGGHSSQGAAYARRWVDQIEDVAAPEFSPNVVW